MAKINQYLITALDEMKTRKLVTPELKWTWESTRHALWFAFKAQVLPELGINPKDVSKENLGIMLAARKAFNTIIDDGYACESSNFGKHAAKAGYCAATVQAASGPQEEV